MGGWSREPASEALPTTPNGARRARIPAAASRAAGTSGSGPDRWAMRAAATESASGGPQSVICGRCESARASCDTSSRSRSCLPAGSRCAPSPACRGRCRRASPPFRMGAIAPRRSVSSPKDLVDVPALEQDLNDLVRVPADGVLVQAKAALGGESGLELERLAVVEPTRGDEVPSLLGDLVVHAPYLQHALHVELDLVRESSATSMSSFSTRVSTMAFAICGMRSLTRRTWRPSTQVAKPGCPGGRWTRRARGRARGAGP